MPTPEPTASPEPVYNGLPSPVASLRASPASPIIPQNAPWATTYTRTSAAPTRTYVWQAPVTSVPYIASVPPGAIWRPLPTLAAYAQTKPLQNTAPAAPAAGPSANGSAATAALFKELARSVKDALSAPETEPQDATCVTPAEFVRCFEPHERRFEEFLEKTQRGEYAALGLVPTMIPKDASVIKSEGYDPMDEGMFQHICVYACINDVHSLYRLMSCFILSILSIFVNRIRFRLLLVCCSCSVFVCRPSQPFVPRFTSCPSLIIYDFADQGCIQRPAHPPRIYYSLRAVLLPLSPFHTRRHFLYFKPHNNSNPIIVSSCSCQ